MGDNFIIQTNSSKFLGVTSDKHLNVGEHINNISLQISESVGVLYWLNSSLLPYILKMFNCLIYGIETWYGASRYIFNRVQVLQKKTARSV